MKRLTWPEAMYRLIADVKIKVLFYKFSLIETPNLKEFNIEMGKDSGRIHKSLMEQIREEFGIITWVNLNNSKQIMEWYLPALIMKHTMKSEKEKFNLKTTPPSKKPLNKMIDVDEIVFKFIKQLLIDLFAVMNAKIDSKDKVSHIRQFINGLKENKQAANFIFFTNATDTGCFDFEFITRRRLSFSEI